MPKINNPQNFKGETLISKENLGLASEDVLATARPAGASPSVDDKVIAADYLPEIVFNNKGTDETKTMGPKIKFIGNCNVVQDPTTGELTIRIGDNLNSSTFNTKDGQTDGTASATDNSSTYPATRITAAAGSKSIWKKGTTDTVTVTTAGKIHFDDAEKTVFNVKVTTNGVTHAYDCGPVTGNGTFGTAPCVLTVSNWAAETKASEGATGFEANVSIVITLSSIVTAEGAVSFEVSSTGTNGAKSFAKDVAYFIVDTATQPKVSNFSAKLTANTTQTWAGITSVKSGTVTYGATVADLNVPATDASNGASIAITNDGFAGGRSKVAQTTYSGAVSFTGSLTTTTTTRSDFGAEIEVWNINGSATATTDLVDNNGNAIAAIDVYAGTPDASITDDNRVTLTSTDTAKTAYSNTAAPGAEDLMIYHGALQYPQAFIDNTYFGNGDYAAPTGTGDKSALFWFSAAGTEPGGTLTINGTGLTGANVKAVVLGNSVNNLLDITSTAGIGTSPTETASKLTYVYSFKKEADHITSTTGCWVKITFSGTGPTITSIVRG